MAYSAQSRPICFGWPLSLLSAWAERVSRQPSISSTIRWAVRKA